MRCWGFRFFSIGRCVAGLVCADVQKDVPSASGV